MRRKRNVFDFRLFSFSHSRRKEIVFDFRMFSFLASENKVFSFYGQNQKKMFSPQGRNSKQSVFSLRLRRTSLPLLSGFPLKALSKNLQNVHNFPGPKGGKPDRSSLRSRTLCGSKFLARFARSREGLILGSLKKKTRLRAFKWPPERVLAFIQD